MRECEMLCDFFVESKWISSNVKPLIYSEYRSLVAQFRSNVIEHDGEWVDFCLVTMKCTAVRTCSLPSSYVVLALPIIPQSRLISPISP